MIRKLVIIGLYVFLPLAAAATTYFGLKYSFIDPVSRAPVEPELFEVAEQQSFGDIARGLEEQGLVRFSWAIKIIAKFKGQDRSVKAGEYELSASMSPAAILDKMASGKTFARKITVKEGASVWEIGVLLQQAGIMNRIEFEAALTDKKLLKEFNIPAISFEGYLFPETYDFPRGTKPRKVIESMYQQLAKNWNGEWDEQLAKLKMDKHQVLTLASIVEKESGSVDEQPLIASVFHNRLARNMKLQADPTVIYGITDFSGNLTKEDLQTPTPYNTYMIDGLPPGPIANPGISAIKAALFPAQTEYLYFVADGTGKHVFSANLNDHNNAVNTYQRGLPPVPGDDGLSKRVKK